jgi:hypothetical protein
MEAPAQRSGHRRRWRILLALLVLAAGFGGVALLYRSTRSVLGAAAQLPANSAIIRWFNDPAARSELVSAFATPCPGYPFLVPSAGFVGGLPWNAAYGPYDTRNPHPGIDIFGVGALGTVPVRAADDGWLTREPDWISAVIIRHEDPLHPGATIWNYYTHMADLSGSTSYILPRFPAGSEEVPVQQGELLGYQGVYNGGAGAPRIAMHMHFSIVRSGPDGRYRNEAVFANTLDPSPYLGLALNDPDGAQYPLRCQPPPGP